MKKLKEIIKFIGENIAAIVAIICGIWTFFTYKGYEIKDLLAYIISILALIASSMLIERIVKISSIEKHIKKLEARMIYNNIFMYCHTVKFWEETEKYAKKIFISGGSLYHVIAERSSIFDRLLENNCEIDIVLVKPHSEAADLLCKEVVKEVYVTEKFSEHTIECLALLKQYRERYPNATITIRLNEHVPPYGIFALYESKKQDIKPRAIQVNFYSGKVAYDKRLALWIENSCAQSQIAYDYFCERIEELKNRIEPTSDEALKSIIGPNT